MSDYLCEYCGYKAHSVFSLTSSTCNRHPAGPNKGRHKLYEGDTDSPFTCKYCGNKNASLFGLTSSTCNRHPDGANKGRHAPML
jgi:hypothetical protein